MEAAETALFVLIYHLYTAGEGVFGSFSAADPGDIGVRQKELLVRLGWMGVVCFVVDLLVYDWFVGVVSSWLYAFTTGQVGFCWGVWRAVEDRLEGGEREKRARQKIVCWGCTRLWC